MRVEYSNTFFDIVRFQAVHQFLSPAAQAFYGVCFLLIFLSEVGERTVPGAFLIALVIWALLWLLQFIFNAVYFASKSNRTVLTSHRAEVGVEGFAEETKFNKSIYFWPGVMKVVSRPGFVAVYVSGQHAHVVPKRAFSSKEQMVEFRQLIAARIAESRGGI